MNKTAFIRARIEPDLKTEVEAIFRELGLTTTQAITMFYKQIQRKHELPLDLHVPNRATARAIREARKGRGTVTCKNVDDLFDNLGV